ncbi:plasmid recombination protein [Floccifex sp.]|uniref:plasmid recombination protein n=1 Tax=Floccifex sp. TaxID=2815810 RepID=UPI003F022269
MQFNDHQEKYKLSDVRGIHGEQFRELKSYKNNVDPQRTHMNQIYIFNPDMDSGNWNKRINECKKIHQKTTGKALRKDAVVFISDVAAVPKEWPKQLILDYFSERNDFMTRFLLNHGVEREYLLSSVVHMDEDEPHQTIVYMPFKDGKFQAKNIMNKIMLKQLQSEGWAFYKDFESRHPEIKEYILEPYIEGNNETKSKKKHLKELDYKIGKDKEKLEQIQKEVSQKQNELDLVDEQILNNPIKEFTENKEIKAIVENLKEDFRKVNNHTDYITENDLNVFIPSFDDNWLEKNVEVVEAKKDLFGNEKQPAYIKISKDEWEIKKAHKESDNRSFHKLENMFGSLKSKYIQLKERYNELSNKIIRKVKIIENSIAGLRKLPVFSKWQDINNNKQMVQSLNDELNNSNQSIQQLSNALNNEKWYHNFYNHVLVLLSRSKTKDGSNALEEVLKDYDENTQDLILDDLETILPKNYRTIIYYNGKQGYGWYVSKDEGGQYLGKKKELEQLQRQYPNASFHDPYNLVFDRGER